MSNLVIVSKIEAEIDTEILRFAGEYGPKFTRLWEGELPKIKGINSEFQLTEFQVAYAHESGATTALLEEALDATEGEFFTEHGVELSEHPDFRIEITIRPPSVYVSDEGKATVVLTFAVAAVCEDLCMQYDRNKK